MTESYRVLVAQKSNLYPIIRLEVMSAQIFKEGSAILRHKFSLFTKQTMETS